MLEPGSDLLTAAKELAMASSTPPFLRTGRSRGAALIKRKKHQPDHLLYPGGGR
jgi:hypothetical protein